MTEGTRSNLWGAMRTAIEVIRPQYAVIENVRGLLSATAQSDSDMEPGTGLMGDGSDLNLRALGRVLGDLADIGYDAKWHGLRAADIGAPHGRYRIFILAWNAQINAAQVRDDENRDSRSQVPSRRSNSTPSNTSRSTIGQHPRGPFTEETRSKGGHGSGDLDGKQPTEFRREAIADTEGWGRGHAHTIDQRQTSREINTPGNHSNATSRASGTPTQWGAYEPAIRRWKHTLGRVAPAPTELSARAKPQLSPVFVEWMMGLPQGWVTDHDLSRADQLKMLGNGVVPQQALRALQVMSGEYYAETA